MELCEECIFPIYLSPTLRRSLSHRTNFNNVYGAWWSMKLGHYNCLKTHLALNPDSIHIVNYIWQPLIVDCVDLNGGYFYGRKVGSETDTSKCVSTLVESGVDVNALSLWWSGGTALHMTVWGERYLLMEMLIRCKADVNVKSKEKKNCLVSAISEDKEDFAWLLLAAGCSTSDVDGRGRSILHYVQRQMVMNEPLNSVMKQLLKRSLSKEPKSLKELSRDSIRDTLISAHPNIMEPVTRLPLPQALIKYLIFNVTLGDN